MSFSSPGVPGGYPVLTLVISKGDWLVFVRRCYGNMPCVLSIRLCSHVSRAYRSRAVHKKSLFPVQQVSVVVASRAAAIFFLFSLFFW